MWGILIFLRARYIVTTVRGISRMEETKGTILIVDDNSLNSELLEATLKPLGVDVIVYDSPQLALKELASVSIDVVLIDIVMPELDGFTFAEKFIKTHKNTSVVFVSAHNANENRVRGFSMGSCVYIEKPFDVTVTRAQIASVLKLKKLQDQLLREKEKLDCIFEFSSNEIILTNLNFDIINQNHKIICSSKNNKKNFLDVLRLNKQNDVLDKLLAFTHSQEKQISFNIIFDEEKHTKTNVSKIFTEKEVTGYLIIIDDRTEEYRVEEQRDQFIETLTHDLKTPVRAEKRALELLYDGSFGELNKDQKDIIKEILNSSRYMMRMTNNILTKYKLDNGKYKVFKRQYSIEKTLTSCLDNLKYMFESENQTIKIISSLTKEIFDYDEREIKRVLTNLIANASEYSPANSTIIISLEQDDENLRISITDEGPGIAEEMLMNLFDEKQSFKPRFKKVGSGMGLYITKKIMEAHNGSISVKSELNVGSTFTLFIPIDKQCVLPAVN